MDECNEVTDYAIARKIVDLHSKVNIGTILSSVLVIFDEKTGTYSTLYLIILSRTEKAEQISSLFNPCFAQLF